MGSYDLSANLIQLQKMTRLVILLFATIWTVVASLNEYNELPSYAEENYPPVGELPDIQDDAGYAVDDSYHEPRYNSPESDYYAEEDQYRGDVSNSYKSVEPLGDTTGKRKYHPTKQDLYSPNEVYKAGDHRDCHFVDKIVYKDECIPYVEKTGRTHQEEDCREVMDKKCTTEVDEDVDRECFEVTELLCQLVESIDYEVIQDSYTVQRCSRITDRICDTVYDPDSDSKDNFQCVKVVNPDCYVEEKIIKDRTCIFSVDFECGKLKMDKVCEKLTNEFPVPVEKQNCHNEYMKQCELEERQRPKKARNFSYRKECKPVKRQVCDDSSKKKLKVTCEKEPRSVCTYEPKEECKDEHKKYCFKTEAKLHEKVCVPDKKVIIDETLSYV